MNKHDRVLVILCVCLGPSMFLPSGLNNPNEKEVAEMGGPLSLVRRSMVRARPVLVSLRNNRKVIGRVVAYDRHYNLLMADTKEVGIVSGKNKGRRKRQGHEVSRRLGNVFIRGDTVILVANGSKVEQGLQNDLGVMQEENTEIHTAQSLDD